MKIAFRADGNKDIATGHLRRCLSIAEELFGRGAEVAFIVADSSCEQVYKGLCMADGFRWPAYTLGVKAGSGAAELPALIKILKEIAPDILFLDSYAFDKEYFERLRSELPKQIKLACIDDLHAVDPPVDLLINYDVNIPKDFYTAPITLLGAEYAPLRAQFCNVPYLIRERAGRVFLSSGGTDPGRILGRILRKIFVEHKEGQEAKDFGCELIMGSLFDEDYKEQLRDLAKEYKSIHIHEAVGGMASIMRRCDIAVSAGGTTVFELCAVGVPTVIFSMADNQIDFAHAFHRSGAAWYIGDSRKDEGLVDSLIRYTADAIHEPQVRSEMSHRARKLVDGRGVQRIADALQECVE